MAEEQIPDAELEVLACIYRKGEITAREIREELEPFRPMAHGSVATLLKRLEQKSLVSKRKGPVGKAFVYRATRKPSSTYRRVVQDLLDRIFGGNGVALVTSLFETNPPTPEEIDQLQDLLNDLKQNAKKGRSRK